MLVRMILAIACLLIVRTLLSFVDSYFDHRDRGSPCGQESGTICREFWILLRNSWG